MARKSLVLILTTLCSAEAFCAACCGGGASLPNLITGDFKAQMTMSASNSAVTHSVDEGGHYKKRDKNSREVSESLTLMGAYQFDDLWQVGVSLPIKKNTYKTNNDTETSSGLGDLKLQLAYEFLPEYSYSRWKPRGFIFIQHTFNNAKSTHEVSKEHGTDALGAGFHTSSLGFSLVKIKRNFDFSFMAEYHKGQKRSFKSEGQKFDVDPGAGHSMLFGLGYSPQNGSLRYGMNIVQSIENKIKTSGDVESKSAGKESTELGANLGYMVGDNSLVLSYTDQSFFGMGKNISSTKVISLNIVQFLSL